MNLYKIGSTPEELQSALINLRADFDSHIHDGASSKNFQTLTAETVSSRVLLVRKTSYTDNASGIWMGLIGNTMALKLGNATNSFAWDGSNLTVIGGTITGGVIRTAASGARVQLDTSYFRVFDSDGVAVSSIFGSDGGNSTVFGVRLQSYAAGDVSTGFFCSVKKGNAMAGFSTGGSDYTCDASDVSGSYSWATSNSTGYATIFLQASSTSYLALDISGSVAVDGQLIVTGDVCFGDDLFVFDDFGVAGTKNSVIDTPEFGRLSLPATEAPTAYFTDSGESVLVGKKTVITIDSKLRSTIEDDSKYLVFVTPFDDIGAFYVKREKGSFTVNAERDGAFSWELKAVRRGYNNFRFGYLEGFETSHVLIDPNTGKKTRVTKSFKLQKGESVKVFKADGKVFKHPEKRLRISTTDESVR